MVTLTKIKTCKLRDRNPRSCFPLSLCQQVPAIRIVPYHLSEKKPNKTKNQQMINQAVFNLFFFDRHPVVTGETVISEERLRVVSFSQSDSKER